MVFRDLFLLLRLFRRLTTEGRVLSKYNNDQKKSYINIILTFGIKHLEFYEARHIMLHTQL